eukprot:COSAG04_NODE_542_length_12865_cov_44.119693_13_plen_823_part_00
MDAGGPAMARPPFTFVVPDGAQPGEVIQVQVLGIVGRVKLPAGTFGGQQLTGTYSREAYGERWQAVLSDERETRRRRLELGKHVPVKSGNHEYDQYVVLSKRVLGQALGFEQCAGLVVGADVAPVVWGLLAEHRRHALAMSPETLGTELLEPDVPTSDAPTSWPDALVRQLRRGRSLFVIVRAWKITAHHNRVAGSGTEHEALVIDETRPSVKVWFLHDREEVWVQVATSSRSAFELVSWGYTLATMTSITNEELPRLGEAALAELARVRYRAQQREQKNSAYAQRRDDLATAVEQKRASDQTLHQLTRLVEDLLPLAISQSLLHAPLSSMESNEERLEAMESIDARVSMDRELRKAAERAKVDHQERAITLARRHESGGALHQAVEKEIRALKRLLEMEVQDERAAERVEKQAAKRAKKEEEQDERAAERAIRATVRSLVRSVVRAERAEKRWQPAAEPKPEAQERLVGVMQAFIQKRSDLGDIQLAAEGARTVWSRHGRLGALWTVVGLGLSNVTGFDGHVNHHAAMLDLCGYPFEQGLSGEGGKSSRYFGLVKALFELLPATCDRLTDELHGCRVLDIAKQHEDGMLRGLHRCVVFTAWYRSVAFGGAGLCAGYDALTHSNSRLEIGMLAGFHVANGRNMLLLGLTAIKYLPAPERDADSGLSAVLSEPVAIEPLALDGSRMQAGPHLTLACRLGLHVSHVRGKHGRQRLEGCFRLVGAWTEEPAPTVDSLRLAIQRELDSAKVAKYTTMRNTVEAYKEVRTDELRGRTVSELAAGALPTRAEWQALKEIWPSKEKRERWQLPTDLAEESAEESDEEDS